MHLCVVVPSSVQTLFVAKFRQEASVRPDAEKTLAESFCVQLQASYVVSPHCASITLRWIGFGRKNHLFLFLDQYKQRALFVDEVKGNL